ncbi:hypothetical protein [Raoultella ornithinolytica]|uniref:hypothetical protein n=1 Tax=Raoultella ornithinolytica TaxID=54291 RepID=UPI000FEB844C|nr:hypothetical protein [Raoultella ornithinolytica]RWT96642.1 hypothetical protein DN602_22365 [Raoultella ornithinolytica]
MEFKDLPLKVQEIAAQCLADRISVTSGFGGGVAKKEPAKDQARQVKEAFVELYASPAASSSQCDCAQKGKNQQVSINVATHIITPIPCKGDGVDRVYHDTMVKALRIELDGLRRKIVMNEIVAN